MTTEQRSSQAVAEKTLVIDADAHVVETERTWEYMDPGEEKYRPVLSSPPDNPNQKFWSIAGKRRGFRFNALSVEAMKERAEKTGRRFDTPEGTSDIHDVAMRLRAMDETGIDVQILFNTLWIEHVADDPAQDVAMAKSWNRWVAEAYKAANGRLYWNCVIPTLDIGAALEQIEFAKENGAVGVSIRPLEGDRVCTDTYFYPVFEKAQELNMCMGVHIANGNPANVALWRSGGGSGLASFRGPTVLACATLLQSNLHKQFPGLRWGFVEASASWMPWLDSELAQRSGSRVHGEHTNAFAEHNIYVTCQNEDDIPYLIARGLIDSLVIGTDFGHFDASSDVDAISKFQNNPDLTAEQKRQILFENPKKLYGL